MIFIVQGLIVSDLKIERLTIWDVNGLKRPSGESLKHRWIPLALICIVIPVGILAAFRLTGVLHEPQTLEVGTADPVYWNISRPLNFVTIDKNIENVYTHGVASVKLKVHVSSYFKDEPTLGDFLWLNIVGAINVSDGFIYSLVMKFSGIDADAFLDVVADVRDKDWVEFQNLTISTVCDSGCANEPYVNAVSVNQPKQCLLRIAAFWVFFDENDVNHWMTTNLEVTYFNGTAYQRISMPIFLGMLID